MSPRRAVHVTAFIAALATGAAVAAAVLGAQDRAEDAAQRHARRLAAVVAAAAQAAHDAPRLVDAALDQPLAAQARLLALAADAAVAATATGKPSDRDAQRRLETTLSAAVADGALRAAALIGPDGAQRLRAETGDPAETDFLDLAALAKAALAKAALAKQAPVVSAAARSPDQAAAFKAAAAPLADGRGAAVLVADARKLQELARLLGVDGMIDGALAAGAADSLWVIDRGGAVLAQGALVGQAGGAFADPEPAAAALAREAAASGRPAASVERGGAVDGVFAAAPMTDKQGERLGAVLLRLPLEGRRDAERDAAQLAALAAAAILSVGFVVGKLTRA